MIASVGSGMMTFTSSTNAHELLYFDQVRTQLIPLPETLVTPRIASRRGHSRIAVSGNASVMVIDLRHTIPRLRSDLRGNKATWITRDHVVDLEDGGFWALHSPNSQRATLERFAPHSELMDISRGRVMFANFPLATTILQVLDVTRMQATVVPGSFGVFIAGGMVYVNAGKLLLRTDEETTGREIATLPSPDVTIVNEESRFWVFVNGELLRGDLASGLVERKPFELPGEVTSYKGRLLVSKGKEIRWDSTDGPLLATVDDNVANMYHVAGGIVVMLASQATLFVAIAANGESTSVQHLSSTTTAATSESGRLLVPSPHGTEIIELPTGQRWIHPMTNLLPYSTSLPPDGSAILELGPNTTWWEWTLPPAGLAVEAMRKTATNAREQDDRVLLWPWQTAR
jgi:hypothetical protein